MRTVKDEFSALVESAFSEAPIPDRFFRRDFDHSKNRDISDELSARIEGRCWREVTLLDWKMIGCPPFVSRSYMEPIAFIYYLPSLIVDTSPRDIAYIDFALEAITPYNQKNLPRGQWWREFAESVSAKQRDTLGEFLTQMRRSIWNEIGPANQNLLERAEHIWLESNE